MNFDIELFVFSFNEISKTNLGDLEKSGGILCNDTCLKLVVSTNKIALVPQSKKVS